MPVSVRLLVPLTAPAVPAVWACWASEARLIASFFVSVASAVKLIGVAADEPVTVVGVLMLLVDTVPWAWTEPLTEEADRVALPPTSALPLIEPFESVRLPPVTIAVPALVPLVSALKLFR